MEERRFFNLRDILIIAFIAVFSIVAFYYFAKGDEGAYAEILYDNKVIKRVDLSVDKEFSLKNYENVVFKVEKGGIAFISSDCPDKVCVRTGFIKNKGQSAVCLPNRLTLRIVGGGDEVDTYTG